MKTLPELGVGQSKDDVVVVVIPLSNTKFLKPTSRKMFCQCRCRRVVGKDVCWTFLRRYSFDLDDPISCDDPEAKDT